MLAGALDMIDGKIAATRPRSHEESSFGIQIDSLCDLVSFGVLPALLLGCFSLPRALEILLGIVFTLAAIIRLSYFNVTELARQETTSGRREAYEGLPVTAVALILPFCYLFSPFLAANFGILYAAVLALCAILFLTPFRLKKPGNGKMLAMGILGTLTLIGMIAI